VWVVVARVDPSGVSTHSQPRPYDGGVKIRSALVLIAFIAICFAVAALGSLTTIQNVDGWYSMADKAPWNPPNAIFGPVWTVLYLIIAVSGWLVWRERRRVDVRRALTLFVAQLVLNALWTPVFFGAYPIIGSAALWIALCIIVAMDVAVLLTMLRFWKVRKASAWLLVPYWAWILFATTLNAAVAILNT
jgi:translocator protein